MKSYREWLQFLYSQLPFFQREGKPAFKKDLSNILTLCSKLGDPHHQFRSIHIAGTNGKGSVSHILSAIYQSAGYQVGLYTSPHYVDFRERIKINGRCISEDDVVTFCERIFHEHNDLQPSFFEITVAMAFDHFARSAVDIAIVETGLGGRLDSTNILSPLLSVITNISLDHQSMLGGTLREIAEEKAGIIKPGVPALIGEHQPEVEEVFRAAAAVADSELHFAENWANYSFEEQSASGITCKKLSQDHPDLPPKVHLSLLGDFQVTNMNTAIAGVSLLSSMKIVRVENSAIIKGLANIQALTNMIGRWQVLQQKPLIVADSGHNEAGFHAAMELVKRADYEQLHMVIGFVKDKDISTMLLFLPKEAKYYWCAADLPRALPAEQLAMQTAPMGLEGKSHPSVLAAFRRAVEEASATDFIFIGGSTFVVAEVLSHAMAD
ncbi:MAG: bifunctional folylpolyglutamate synthase/dihydrofolate synthase [Saprospiraceae bacterium]|nr:bifunctional folylpolyglutamate synthase/dihydrofolate synthase [Saprospiraceae bacterium]